MDNSRVYSYFPGCSLATSAKENNLTLLHALQQVGIELEELEDWNCCGSSSAHSIDAETADKLAMRNLALAPTGRPLVVACPSCNLRLATARHKLEVSAEARHRFRRWFGRNPDPDLKVVHVFELLAGIDWNRFNGAAAERLKGLRCAPYYGCMLARPPALRRQANHNGLMEKVLGDLGAVPISWSFANRCCGSFLSAVRPDVVSPMVQQIMAQAASAGAECVVTACAMCHMNLEIRSDSPHRLPVFHFSELLAMATGQKELPSLLQRHLIDPLPLLREKGLVA